MTGMMMTTANRAKSSAAVESTLAELEGLADRIGVRVRYERLAQGPVRATHGTCRLREEDLVIIDSRMSPLERLSVLSRELRRFSFDDVFVPPALRDWLDGAPARS